MPNIHCLHVLGGAVTVQPALLDDSRKVINMRYVIDRRHGGILTLAKDSGTTFFQPQSPQITTFRPPFAIHVFWTIQDDHGFTKFSPSIEVAEVVDPEARRTGQAATRAFFGATVRYANAAGAERAVSIVGTDEIDLNRNHISWVSPLGRALMKSAAGDSVVLQLPGGTEHLTVLDVRYERISVEPFREPPGSQASAKGLPRRQ